MQIIEYGVNEVMPRTGVKSNPFDFNFPSQEAATEVGKDLLREHVREGSDITEVVIFELTLEGNTIINDVTLETITRDSV